jgi:hypothetical protein
MTRDQIAAKVQTNLNDVGVFYSLTDLSDSIQDGYSEVAAFTGCIFKMTTINLSANLSYYDLGALIPNFFAVTAIFNPQNKQWLSPVSLRRLEDMRNDWELATGNPFAFWPINFRFIAIFPRVTVTSGTLYIVYRAQADILTASATPQIPTHLQGGLEQYSTGDLLEQAEEFTKAQIELEQYFNSLKDIKNAKNTFRLPDLMSRLG